MNATNPLFNQNRMKLGTFCTNCSNGTVASTAEGTLKLSWAITKELAQGADQAGFEALVPVGRWKGFGGLTDFNGDSFEVFTWAAGLAEATSYRETMTVTPLDVELRHPPSDLCLGFPGGVAIRSSGRPRASSTSWWSSRMSESRDASSPG
ncbi:MAG TPA: hypothetical protein VGK54_06680 [Chloroflexota bacterium]